MIIAMIEGATRVCGKAQGYLGLPIRDEQIIDNATARVVNCMHTAWEPTPDELARLNAGGKVIISIFGVTPAPMMVNVSKPSDD